MRAIGLPQPCCRPRPGSWSPMSCSNDSFHRWPKTAKKSRDHGRARGHLMRQALCRVTGKAGIAARFSPYLLQRRKIGCQWSSMSCRYDAERKMCFSGDLHARHDRAQPSARNRGNAHPGLFDLTPRSSDRSSDRIGLQSRRSLSVTEFLWEPSDCK